MRFRLKKEIWPILAIMVPYFYLPLVWQRLPDQIPIHWNASSEADNWAPKSAAWAFPILLCGGMYALFWLLLWIDPKQKLAEMGGKFHQMKVCVVTAFSALIILIFYYLQKGDMEKGTTFPLMFEGLLFAIMGNFFQSLKPNYFLGIRTPWTLESEWVWKKTHRVFGWVWVVSGLILLAIALFVPIGGSASLLSQLTLGILAGGPYVFSFVIWKWPTLFYKAKP